MKHEQSFEHFITAAVSVICILAAFYLAFTHL